MAEQSVSSGPFYIGGMISMMAYGITTLQTFFYFNHYYSDPRKMRLLVASISFLDTLHTALICHANYFYLVEGITTPAFRIEGIWSFYVSTGVNAVIAFVVQLFFLYRVHRLLRRSWRWRITFTIITLIVVHLGVALYNTIEYFGGNLLYTKDAGVAAWMNAGLNVTVDVVLSFMLYRCLRNLRSEDARANAIIRKICFFMANRFLLTVLVVLVEVILFASTPTTYNWVALELVFGKVQSNALLAILNGRRAIKGQGTYDDVNTDTSTATDPTTAASPTTLPPRDRTPATCMSSLRHIGNDSSVYDMRGTFALHSADFANDEESGSAEWAVNSRTVACIDEDLPGAN